MTTVVNYELGWDGVCLKGTHRSPLSFDTETELADDVSIPRLALWSASDGDRTVVVHPDSLFDFLLAHAGIPWVCHNTVFDFWVCMRHARDAKRKDIEALLWSQVDQNLWHDSLILDQLVRLAQGRGEDGTEKFYSHNLDKVAFEYAGVRVDKKDPYRMRYAEFLGLPFSTWPSLERGFFEYAAYDTFVLHKLYPHLRKEAVIQMRRASPAYHRPWHELASEYGLLTESIQVKGSIALADMSRRGLAFDPILAEEAEKAARGEALAALERLRQAAPGMFRSYKGREINQKSNGMPGLDTKAVSDKLWQVSEHLKKVVPGFEVPMARGKNEGISRSADDWAPYQKYDPFLEAWIDYCSTTTHLRFFSHFRPGENLFVPKGESAVRSKMINLVRTGRTSSQEPNLQNCPKEESFRSIFVARSGKKFYAADYSAVELRTLAAAAQARFGHSKMTEVIKAGVDLHTHTASLLNGRDYNELLSWVEVPDGDPRKSDPRHKEAKTQRQAAKACFHPDVQLLTPNGWKKISSITYKDRVAQYDASSASVTFVPPIVITFQKQKDIIRLKTRHLETRITPDHTMYFVDRAGRPGKCSASDYTEMCYKSVHAGVLAQGVSTNLDELRRAVCTQADGTVHGQSYVYMFSKPPKIDRFRELFCGTIEGESGPDSRGLIRFRFAGELSFGGLLTDTKTYSVRHLLEMDHASRVAFLEELYYWDGTHRTSHKCFSVTTVEPDVIDTIQAVAAVTGYRSVVNTWMPKLGTRPAYSISLFRGTTAQPSNISIESIGKSDVYCVEVPSSLLITRDNNNVLIIGNCGFGIPGGLGAKALVQYAELQYGVTLTEAQADDFRRKLIREIYPELSDRDGYLADEFPYSMACALDVTPTLVRRAFGLDPEKGWLPWTIRRILSGATSKADGEPYSSRVLSAIKMGLQRLVSAAGDNAIPWVKVALSSETYTPSLANECFRARSVTLTGRVRAGVRYTALKNTVFQGLAADGAKLALYECIKAGVSVVVFVHDEIGAEVDTGVAGLAQAEFIRKTMVEGMEKVLEGRVPVEVKGRIGDCWAK